MTGCNDWYIPCFQEFQSLQAFLTWEGRGESGGTALAREFFMHGEESAYTFTCTPIPKSGSATASVRFRCYKDINTAVSMPKTLNSTSKNLGQLILTLFLKEIIMEYVYGFTEDNEKVVIGTVETSTAHILVSGTADDNYVYLTYTDGDAQYAYTVTGRPSSPTVNCDAPGTFTPDGPAPYGFGFFYTEDNVEIYLVLKFNP